jgi:hypothetical protein
MFRNSSRTLFEQIMSQRFLETLEDALTSPRTEMFVKERHMDVLGAIVYACANGEVFLIDGSGRPASALLS